MLFTNGKVLVSANNDAEELHKAVRKMKNWLFEENGVEAEFTFDDTVAYPCYLVPEGVTYAQLDKVLRPKISLRAINEDIITLPETKEIEILHHFSDDELQKMGADISAKVLLLSRVKTRKQASMAEFAAEEKRLNKEIQETARHHENGYEERTFVVEQKLNFAEGIKYYVDPNDHVTVRDSEPMKPADYQLRIDTLRDPLYNPEAGEAVPDGDENGPAFMQEEAAAAVPFAELPVQEQESWLDAACNVLPADATPEEVEVQAVKLYNDSRPVAAEAQVPFADLPEEEQNKWFEKALASLPEDSAFSEEQAQAEKLYNESLQQPENAPEALAEPETYSEGDAGGLTAQRGGTPLE